MLRIDDVAGTRWLVESDWLALDCELLPCSAKAIELITSQNASVGAPARHALPGGGRGD